MEYNERNITAVEVFKKLKEVEKQNKEILARLENMQESNELFHNGFATIFEVLRGLNEVKQDKGCVDMLKAGSLAHILSAESFRKKHMKNNKSEQGRERRNSCVERVNEAKVKDAIEFLKMLENI